MGYPNEQIRGSRGVVRANWVWLKKMTARLRRRQAKRDPEGAPTRGYRGWVA